MMKGVTPATGRKMQKALLRHPPPTLFKTSLPATFEYFTPEELAQQMVGLAHAGDELALQWLDRLVDEGLSKKLLDDVIVISGSIEITAYPKLVVGKRKVAFEYAYRDSIQQLKEELMQGPAGLDEDEAARRAVLPRYGHALLQIINAGLASRIQRCALKECGRIFFGDARAKWCSKTCGSKFRVRNKRKKDSQR